MAEWLEIAVPVEAGWEEEVAAWLAEEVSAARAGTEIRAAEVVFWVEAGAEAAALAETIALVRRLSAAAVPVREAAVCARAAAPEASWRDAWKRSFRTTRLTRQLVVVPSWEEYAPEPSDRVIHLDPGQAFGTGAHASTRLLLEAMQEVRDRRAPARAVESFLDVGAGSGILAIAAALLWPGAKGLAVDIDPVAVRVARENVVANGVGSRVEVREGPAEGIAGRFDLVAANLQRDVLLDLRDSLAARVAPGGWLMLSGLYGGQAEEVAARYADLAGFRPPEVHRSRHDPEWSAVSSTRFDLRAAEAV